ncbi:flavin-containing monooxygenase FMO GS-OX-like protein 4 [Cinnamomum micranthum f. kanehirae]|uniref:Flavin-containing monooxygenase n=1 Tax=Cinnamomum micranthum f. kanehirae TaxID=337451 RepID=A0A3S3N3A2_9MAGN|nr:flavin-containing monooxygenase FMO GS-OX-like protein 4 [Cinnamomum micranthum f. kanehirae]
MQSSTSFHSLSMAAPPIRDPAAMYPHLPSSNGPQIRSCHVAVIGAGAAGLVAARELRREGHKVVVFESGDSVGGTWVYSPSVDSDPLGLDPYRKKVQTSLYQSLRTNLPRESMGFRDYPFVAKPTNKERDSRRFPGHGEVLLYLQDFAVDFGLMGLVRFKTEVFDVHLVDEGRWMVRSRTVRMDGYDDDDENEVYDGVVVCNGHYMEPRIAEIPGIDVWPGKQIHSHNYRVPEPFQDQVVILIGSSASAVDISRDICAFAKEVHVSSRSAPDKQPASKQPGYDNMWLHSMIESAHDDGTVVFRDGSSVLADVILHCTGYKYDFPFLKVNGVVTVDDNRVGPLYKHIFPPLLAPSLSFIGLPWKVVPFPLFEMQSKWVASVLSGRLALPSQEEMMMDVEAFYSKLDAAGMPKRYTHSMSDYQFDYTDELAAECGYPAVEEWRKQMYAMSWENKVARPESYRDEWDDHSLVLQAHEYFLRYCKASI